MIALNHQILRASLVCHDRDQDSYFGEREDMSASLRQEESILDTCTAYGEERERGMDIYEALQLCGLVQGSCIREGFKN
jgi:hypothetical protein